MSSTVCGAGPALMPEAASGIGLAVVEELVTALGGTVTAGSEPGGGTRMTLRLPRAAPHGARLVPSPGAEP
ncbi:ATP-binding protein [Streptomyces scabiei]|uniref:ATP-binding protein n=1 Tax=Streptomyces scabiei TaxID=1930 RepID=UPI00298FE507|nr:ATP-binding protein [Streptomyces scabiei]MDW8803808.1 ATP-binding protein [Streptomyces scabiei]